MTLHTDFPAFIVIHYVSQFGEHIMKRHTRAWIDPEDPSDDGSFTAWDTTNVLLPDMVNDFVDTLAELAPTDVAFNRAELYTIAEEGDDPILKRIIPLTQVGTNGTVAQVQATEHTYTFKDTAGFISKVVYLDFQATAWDKINNLTGLSADQLAMTAAYVSDANAWASKAGNQPTLFLQMTRKLNDALRKKYGMT